MRKLFFNRPYRELEKKLGHKFKNSVLLEEALTHSSRKAEGASFDNQRMEFLGDAVLALVTSEHLYEKYPDCDEGKLTAMRIQMINAKALITIGNALEVSKYIILGKSERESGGEKKLSNIADVVEAIIGAIYLDGGLKSARKIFSKLFLPNLNVIPEDHFVDNFKGLLQFKVQKKCHENPQYHIVETFGPPHAMEFLVEVKICGKFFGKGRGKTKREAEQKAAHEALLKLGENAV
jgi:ribonuclease-3